MAALSGSKYGLPRRGVELMIEGITFSVFAVLDFVDQLLCPLFALLDSLLDSELETCYCRKNVQHDSSLFISPLLSSTQELNRKKDSVLENWRRSSDTVYAKQRRSGRSRVHMVPLHRVLSSELANCQDTYEGAKVPTEANGFDLSSVQEHGQQLGQDAALCTGDKPRLSSGFSQIPLRSRNEEKLVRWSDCGCENCTSWHVDDKNLYIQVDDKDFVASPGIDGLVQRAENNVIFLHGFLSSSCFWTDLVMPALPQDVRASHRLFAMDILGFGKSPKPSSIFYTLTDHVDIIQRSLLQPHGIQKYHLVAHSMGCTIALALAAQFPAAVKSITLLAPPYFPAPSGITPDIYTMQQLAPRKIWPLVAFGSAVMSWYEHLGRLVCLIICKNHRIWEPVLSFLSTMIPGYRIPLSSVTGFTQHTHHSAWHIFHNTICTGAHAADYFFEVLLKAGRRVRVIHGTRDTIIPFKQSETLSSCHPNVVLTPVLFANHVSIVLGRESELALELAEEFKLADNSL